MFLRIIVVDDPSDRAALVTADPLLVPFHEPMVIGRAERGASDGPDIDLAPFDAAQNGVSRHHARLEPCDGSVLLTDLNSMNGTYLNDMHITPHHSYPLSENDEVRLGKLVVFIGVIS